MSYGAYGKQANTTGYSNIPMGGSPVDTEAWALIECARRLSEAGNDAENPRKAMKDALRLNWRLWTIFQAELSADYCPVPEDIRINMLTLCQFVDKHTISALIEPSPERLKVLVEMNRNIAAGLLAGKEKGDADTPQPSIADQALAAGSINAVG